MQSLTVLYDPKCNLCCRLKDWLLAQPCWIRLDMIPAGSEQARRAFPALDQIATPSDLAVISDTGEVYLNDRAWIMTMYATVEYRDWAARLTHPLLLPLARQAFAAISANRHVLSRWLIAPNAKVVADELSRLTLDPCTVPATVEPAPDIREYLE